MDRSARRYWDQLALRWRFSPPLSPGPEDARWYEGVLARLADGKANLEVMQLGVTPAVAGMRWPQAARVLAADWSVPMLTRVWPADRTPPGALRLCADWRQLPLEPAAIDVIVTDGCYTALPNVTDYRSVNLELHRVLRPGGSMLVRCCCRPSRRLDTDWLFEELFAGRIPSLDLFRFLLAMSMHDGTRTEISRRAVGEAWRRHVPDARTIQPRMGWSDDELANMERSAASDNTFCFPTLEELLAVARPQFEAAARDVPAYAWGELFPRIELRAV